MKKTPIIIYENQTNVDFHGKCNAFVKALFPKSPQNNLSNNEQYSDENSMKWPDSIANEIENAVKTFNPKKACGPDGINFHII